MKNDWIILFLNGNGKKNNQQMVSHADREIPAIQYTGELEIKSASFTTQVLCLPVKIFLSILMINSWFYFLCLFLLHTYLALPFALYHAHAVFCPSTGLSLILVLLNRLIWQTPLSLSINQITCTWCSVCFKLLNGNQWRPSSNGFFRSNLIRIYTICKS